LVLYVKGYHAGSTSSTSTAAFVVKTTSINVCDGEVVSVLNSANEVTAFEKLASGAAAQIANFQTVIQGAFQSLPVNAANANCNLILTTLYDDAALTTPFSGSALIP